MLTWKEVINFSVNGNPVPDKRVDKSDAEWQEILTPEQFRITRLKGTERCAVFTKLGNTIVCAVTLLCSIPPSNLNRAQVGQVLPNP